MPGLIFTFPLLKPKQSNAARSSETIKVTIERKAAIKRLAGLLTCSTTQDPYNQYKSLQYQFTGDCEVMLEYKGETKRDIPITAHFDFGVTDPLSGNDPVTATLLRGFLYIPKEKLGVLFEGITKDLWPFDGSSFTALRFEPTGVHVQGKAPERLCSQFAGKEVSLRCPQNKFETLSLNETDTQHPFWTLAADPLPVDARPYDPKKVTLGAKEWVESLKNNFTSFEQNDSWLDNIEYEPDERCHVRFLAISTDPGNQVHWQALHIGTRISIAAGIGENRSSETTFRPNVLAGILKTDQTVERYPVYLTWDPKLPVPRPGTIETRFANLTQDTLDHCNIRLTYPKPTEPDAREDRQYQLNPVALVCQHAPLHVRTTPGTETTAHEIWCCTQDGWLAISGSSLVHQNSDLDLRHGAGGLSGAIDLLALINGMEGGHPPFARLDWSCEVSANRQTRLFCEFTRTSATIAVLNPVYVVKTPAIFLAELPAPTTDPTTGASAPPPAGKAMDGLEDSQKEELFSHPLSVPDLRPRIADGGRPVNIADRFAQMTLVSYQAQDPPGAGALCATMTLRVDSLGHIDFTLSQTSQSNDTPAGISFVAWSVAATPLARTYPDPQAIASPRAAEHDESSLTERTTPVKALDGTRGLHPAVWKTSNAGPSLTFQPEQLPSFADNTAFSYPGFPRVWEPYSEFALQRSFLPALPGIEYQYPEKSNAGVEAKWGYRFANPAMDEAYARVQEDSDAGLRTITQAFLTGPDTTRVADSVAFAQGGTTLQGFLPRGLKEQTDEISITTTPFETPELSLTFQGRLASLGTHTLKRPTQENTDADLLPSLTLSPIWENNRVTDVSVTTLNPATAKATTPVIVGHGQSLMCGASDNSALNIQDARGVAIHLPTSSSKRSFNESDFQNNNTQINRTRREDVVTLEVETSNDGGTTLTWDLHLMGTSEGEYKNIEQDLNESCKEYWALYQSENKEQPSLWGFPFLPTRLANLDQSSIMIEGIWLARTLGNSTGAANKTEVEKAEDKKKGEALPGSGQVTLSFTKKGDTFQLSKVHGSADWRFETNSDPTAQLSRLSLSIILPPPTAGQSTISRPKFTIQELSLQTPAGLVRMNDKESLTICELTTVIGTNKPAILVAVKEWNANANGQEPTSATRHSVGPFVIQPTDDKPRLFAYDLQWTTPAGDDAESKYHSIIGFGSTPEYRSADLKTLAVLLEQEAPLLNSGDLQRIAGFDQEASKRIDDYAHRYLQAANNNTRRKELFAERIIQELNQWVTETEANKAHVLEKLIPAQPSALILADEPSHLVLEFTNQDPIILTKQKATLEEAYFLEPQKSFHPTKEAPNPLLHNWEVNPVPAIKYVEFDTAIRNGNKNWEEAVIDPNNNSCTWKILNSSPLKHTASFGETGLAHWVATFTLDVRDLGTSTFELIFKGLSGAQTVSLVLSLIDEGGTKKLKVGTTTTVLPDSPITITVIGYEANVRVHIPGLNALTLIPQSLLSLTSVSFGFSATGDAPKFVVIHGIDVHEIVETLTCPPGMSYKVTEQMNLTLSTKPARFDADIVCSALQIAVFSKKSVDPADKPLDFTIHPVTITHVREELATMCRHLQATDKPHDHLLRWIKRSLLDAFLTRFPVAVKAVTTGSPVPPLNWDHRWHCQATETRQGKQAPIALLGDVRMNPIQLNSDKVVFSITDEVYIDLSDASRLNSHLRIQPIGGYLGAEVHWEPFLHFQHTAMELQLHLTDRRQRDAIALWTPPNKEVNRDYLRIREYRVGEIQAFDGFSPSNTDDQNNEGLKIYWLERDGSFKTWEALASNRITSQLMTLSNKKLLTADSPLLQSIVSTANSTSDAYYSFLLIDDAAVVSKVNVTPYPEDNKVVPLVRSLLIHWGNADPESNVLASNIWFKQDIKIALLRSSHKIDTNNAHEYIIETHDPQSGPGNYPETYKPTQPVITASFMNGDRLVWVENGHLKIDDKLQSINSASNIHAAIPLDQTKLLLLYERNNQHYIGIYTLDDTQITSETTVAGSGLEIEQAVRLADDFMVLKRQGTWYGVRITETGQSISLDAQPLVLNDVDIKQVRSLRQSANTIQLGLHLMVQGVGSQTNCVGVLRFGNSSSPELYLTGKIVLHNDIDLSVKKKIAGEDIDPSCYHRIDFFMDRAKLPIEVIYAGPEEDFVVSGVAKHVFRCPEGRERTWQAPQSLRFTTVGRMSTVLGSPIEPKSDSRLVIDGSSVLLLEEMKTTHSKQAQGWGKGIVQNRFLNIGLTPYTRPPERFQSPGTTLVQIPFLASTAFTNEEDANQATAGTQKKIERPKIKVNIAQDNQPSLKGLLGDQWPTLSPQPIQPNGLDVTSNPGSIAFLYRNAPASWLNAEFLAYTLAPEPPTRHGRTQWPVPLPWSPTNDLLWPVIGNDTSTSMPNKIDLSGIFPDSEAKTKEPRKVYEGDRIQFRAAALTHKMAIAGEIATGPCLVEFPFLVDASRPESVVRERYARYFQALVSGAETAWEPAPALEVQLVIYQEGTFQTLVRDSLQVTDENRQSNNQGTLTTSRNAEILEKAKEALDQLVRDWAHAELQRRRVVDAAFVVVDFEEVVTIPPRSFTGLEYLPHAPINPPQAVTWPAPESLSQIRSRDPRCLNNAFFTQRLTSTQGGLWAPYYAQPTMTTDKQNANFVPPVSATHWKLAFLEPGLSLSKGDVAVPTAANAQTKEKGPMILAWNESIPFEIQGNEYPSGRFNGQPTGVPISSVAKTEYQWIRVPQIDVIAWSARPGEMTCNSMQALEFDTSIALKLSPQLSFQLRRARAVAARDETVSLAFAQPLPPSQELGSDSGLTKKFVHERLLLTQALKKTTAMNMAYLVTRTAVHEGQESPPPVALPLMGSNEKITEPIDWWRILDQAIPEGSCVVLLKLATEAQIHVNITAEQWTNTTLGIFVKETDQAGSNAYKFQAHDTQAKPTWEVGDYVTARYDRQPDSSWKHNTDFPVKRFKLSAMASASVLRPPAVAVAVIASTQSQPVKQQLVGYGHLEADDFSLVTPIINTGDIEWIKRAELSVIHRCFAQADRYAYDIVVTGPAGQTYPTVGAPISRPAAQPQ